MGTQRRIHKSHGVTTGLGICAYFVAIFEANEISPKRKKLTDEQIAILIEKEFPNRASAKVYRGNNKKRTINEYRHRYHSGKFTGNRIPAIYSFRYNEAGDRVDGRTGKEVLPTIQTLGLASQQRYWSERQRSEENMGQPSKQE